MFLLYAESMADMEGNLKIVMKWRHHMRRFKGVYRKSKADGFVETVEKQWVCGLRAVESEPGEMVFEAVETRPGQRNRGYGKN